MRKKPLWVGITGFVIAALCCATPLAVILLGAIGLGALSVWIDVVAIPTALIFGAVAVMAYLKRG